jgi:TnpA family transposase
MSCANYAEDEDQRRRIAEWIEKEEEWNSRINIIGQNGPTGEHYEEAHEDLLPSDGHKPS